MDGMGRFWGSRIGGRAGEKMPDVTGLEVGDRPGEGGADVSRRRCVGEKVHWQTRAESHSSVGGQGQSQLVSGDSSRGVEIEIEPWK